MSEKTTSLKLSKKLKDAGAVQESEWRWCDDTLAWCEESDCDNSEPSCHGTDGCASFDCAELLGRLPESAGIVKPADGGYKASIDVPNGYSYSHEDSHVEALGNLYLWCLKNGHCK